MSPDPYKNSGGPGLPQSWNRYSYVIGDPINLIDPQGTTFRFVNPSTGAIEECYDSVDVVGSLGGLSGGGGSGYGTTNIPTDPLGLSARQAYNLAIAYIPLVKNKTLNSCQALADFAADASDQSASQQQFVNAFGVFVDKTAETQTAGISYNTSPVGLYLGRDNGFTSIFQNTVPDNNPGPGDNGDQIHHFAAFFELGYQDGALTGAVTAGILEVIQGFRTTVNQGDIALGMMASALGADLKANNVSTGDIANMIRGLYCH